MFTGLIDHCGEIKECAQGEHGMSLWIKTQFKELVDGESIAVDGICLTVVESSEYGFRCDLSPETLKVTTAKYFEIGHRINLEQSLTPSDKLGGHFVYGHVDQTARVANKKSFDDFTQVTFSGFSEENKCLLVRKGSVAINGVSLTINNVTDDYFDVMLIPETLRLTNLSGLQVGQSVNIEYDYLAKLVVNTVSRLKDTT